MKEIQISRKEIRVFRNEIQAEAEQIPNPAERNPNSHHWLSFAFSKTYAKPTQPFVIFGPIPASNAAAMQALRVRLGLFVLRSSFSVPPIFFKQVKGWRLLRSRMASLWDAWARFPSDLSAAEPRCAKRGIPASTDPRGYEPGDRGPADKDRPIDPMCGKNSPASIRARSRFEPNGQADGRQPFMPQDYLTNACL